MHYLPSKLLNHNPIVSAKEQYTLVKILENFKARVNGIIEAKRGFKPEKETPEGDEITNDELNHLISILSDIESKKKPITRIAYLKALNLLQQDIKHLPILKNVFKHKGMTKNISIPIESILSDNTSQHINDLVNYIREGPQVSAGELANTPTPAPVEELFPSLHSYLVKSLFSTTVPGGGGKGTGKGELALILLLKDAKHPAKGDVEVPEGIIEVKQGEGAEQSAGRISGAQNIYGDVKSAFVKNFADIFAQGGPEITNMANTTYWYNLNDKNLNLFIQMLGQVIQASPGVNIRGQVVAAYRNSIDVYLKNFNSEAVSAIVENSFDSNGYPIKDTLVKGIFKLSFMYYHHIEGFKYFAVYKDGELFFKAYEDSVKAIDEDILTYADVPNFQDTRANAFKVTF